MGDKHVVRFEPVGIEIEVGEEQTILRAAFEQGVMLMHGCKEGQCSSCKSFVLDGEDIELDRYSTFALPDFEKDEGYTLLCRAHAYEDLTIELLNYDEDMIRSGLPITQAVAEVVSKDPVTHDMRHLVLRLVEPADVKFFPGQYMDIEIPGSGATRSFSMANTSARDSGQLEFVIKVYPDGLFSHFLDTTLQVGDRLDLSGPYGVFTLREGDVPLHPGAVRAGRCGPLGRRDRPDHRRAPAARDGGPVQGTRLRLRPTADGRGGDSAARPARRAGEAHLLRQVHHDRRSRGGVRPHQTRRRPAVPRPLVSHQRREPNDNRS